MTPAPVMSPPEPTISWAVMPLAACPAISQSMSYWPSATLPSSSCSLWPGCRSAVLTPRAGIDRLCTIVPSLVTLRTTSPAGISVMIGPICHSFRLTSTSVTPPASLSPPAAELSSCNPKMASTRAAIATANAPQPRTERSALLIVLSTMRGADRGVQGHKTGPPGTKVPSTPPAGTRRRRRATRRAASTGDADQCADQCVISG